MIELVLVVCGVGLGALAYRWRSVRYRRRWREASDLVFRQHDYIDQLESEVVRLGGKLDARNAALNEQAAKLRGQRMSLVDRMKVDAARKAKRRNRWAA